MLNNCYFNIFKQDYYFLNHLLSGTFILLTSIFNKDRLTDEKVLLKKSYITERRRKMLSKKEQFVTWSIWSVLSPVLFIAAFNISANLSIFYDLAFYTLIL